MQVSLNENHYLARYVSFAIFGAEGIGAPSSVAPIKEAGTTFGDPMWGKGRYGPILRYDGTVDHHQFPNRTLLSSDRPFTVIIRFKIRSFVSTIPIIFTAQTDSGQPSILFFASALAFYKPFTFGKLKTSGGSGMGPTTNDGTDIAFDVWHDIAYSYDGTGDVNLDQPSSWSLVWNQKVETVITAFAYGTTTNRTGLGAAGNGANPTDCDIDYVIVLDGVSVAEQFTRPIQVLRLLRPSSFILPTGASAATGTQGVVRRRVAI